MDDLADELNLTVTQLLPGFEKLFNDHAIPDFAGAFFLERSFLAFLSPTFEKYLHKHVALQAYQAILALERRNGSTIPGLTFQGMIAALCKVSEDTFSGPAWASFASPSERLRLLVFLCDTGHRYFKQVMAPASARYEDSSRVLREKVATPLKQSGVKSADTAGAPLSSKESFRHVETLHQPGFAPNFLRPTASFTRKTGAPFVSHRSTSSIATVDCLDVVDYDRPPSSAAVEQPAQASSVSPMEEFLRAVAKTRQETSPTDKLAATRADATLKHAQEIEQSASTKGELFSPGMQLRQSWAQHKADIDAFINSLPLVSPTATPSQRSREPSSASLPVPSESAAHDAELPNIQDLLESATLAVRDRLSRGSETLPAATMPLTPEPQPTASRLQREAEEAFHLSKAAASSTNVASSLPSNRRSEKRVGLLMARASAIPSVLTPPLAAPPVPEGVPRQLPTWAVTAHDTLTAGHLHISKCEHMMSALFHRYCLYGEREKSVHTMHVSEDTRATRIHMNQFAKFAQDARIVGRGGHGAGYVNRGDIDVIFKAAAARMSGAGSQPALVKLWKQNSYTLREVARSMLNVGLDYPSFNHALLLLATRRYCRPDSQASTRLGMSTQPASAYPMTSKPVLRANQEEVALQDWMNRYAASVPEADRPVAAGNVSAVCALRLLILNHVAPLAISMGIIDALPDVMAHDPQDNESTFEAVVEAFAPPSGGDDLERSIQQRVYDAVASAAEDSLSTAETEQMMSSPPNEPAEGDLQLQPEAQPEPHRRHTITGALQLSHYINETSQQAAQMHPATDFRATMTLQEDNMQDPATLFATHHFVPTETVVPNDMKLLHRNAVANVTAALTPAVASEPPSAAHVSAAAALASSKSMFLNGVRTTNVARLQSFETSPNTTMRSNEGERSRSDFLEANKADVQIRGPLGLSPHSTSKYRHRSPTACSTSRALHIHQEFSQAGLLPRVRAASSSPTKRKPTLVENSQAAPNVQPMKLSPSNIHLIAMKAAEAAARAAIAAVMPAVNLRDAPAARTSFDLGADASSGIQENYVNESSINVQPDAQDESLLSSGTDTLAASRHVAWKDETAGIITDETPAAEQPDATKMWGPSSDGEREAEGSVAVTSPDVKPKSSLEASMFTPAPVSKPQKAMPTTDRAQREWQRKFMADGSTPEQSPLESAPAAKEEAEDTSESNDIETTVVSLLTEMEAVPQVQPPSQPYQFVRSMDEAASPGALYAVPLSPPHQHHSSGNAHAPIHHETPAAEPRSASNSRAVYTSRDAADDSRSSAPIHIQVRNSGIDVFRGNSDASVASTHNGTFADQTGTRSLHSDGSQSTATTVIRVHRSGSFDIESQPDTRMALNLMSTVPPSERRPSVSRISRSSTMHQPAPTGTAPMRRMARSPQRMSAPNFQSVIHSVDMHTSPTDSGLPNNISSMSSPVTRSVASSQYPVAGAPPALGDARMFIAPVSTTAVLIQSPTPPRVLPAPAQSHTSPVPNILAEHDAPASPRPPAGDLHLLVGRLLPLQSPRRVQRWTAPGSSQSTLAQRTGRPQGLASSHTGEEADVPQSGDVILRHIGAVEEHRHVVIVPPPVPTHAEPVPAASSHISKRSPARLRSRSPLARSSREPSVGRDPPSSSQRTINALRRELKPTQNLVVEPRTVLTRQADDGGFKPVWGSSATGTSHAKVMPQVRAQPVSPAVTRRNRK